MLLKVHVYSACLVLYSKKNSISTSTREWPSTLARFSPRLNWLQSPGNGTQLSSDLVTFAKRCISTSTLPMTIKLDRSVNCGEETSPSASPNLSITWSHDLRKTLHFRFHNSTELSWKYQTWKNSHIHHFTDLEIL